jgi:septin family protein
MSEFHDGTETPSSASDSDSELDFFVLDDEGDYEAPPKNVVIVGMTGNGKSALANTICNQTDYFQESDDVCSITSTSKSKILGYNGQRYRIVDTIGIGDNRISCENVLMSLADTCSKLENGIFALIFVTKGRFSTYELETYEYFRDVIFGTEILEHIIVVRTNTANFLRDPHINERLQDSLIRNISGAEHMSLVNEIFMATQLVCVNNPGPNDGIPDWETTRKSSREILLSQLQRRSDAGRSSYIPPNLSVIQRRITKYIAEYKNIKARLTETQSHIEALRRRLQEAETQRTTFEKTLRRELDDETTKALTLRDHELQAKDAIIFEMRKTMRDLEDKLGRMEISGSPRTGLSMPMLGEICNIL